MADERTHSFLSAILIIGVPTVFWMVLIEVVSAVAGLNYGMQERLIVGGVIVAFLALIFGLAREAGR